MRALRLGAGMSAVLLGLVVALAPAAWAGAAYSTWGYYGAGGVNYRNRATIQTDSIQHWAFGIAGAGPTSTSVGAGWVGAKGNLYGTSGALYCAGTMTYNTSTLSANGTLWSSSSCTKYQVGNWQARGTTQAWVSSGSYYVNFSTNTTPAQSS